MQAAVGTAVITPQRRSKRAPQGSVSSLWTGVSKYHYPPCCHRVPACQGRLKECVDRSASLSVHLLKLASWRRTFYRCSHGFCACNTVYSVLKVREGDIGETHLSPITKKRGVCYLFSPPSGKKAEIFFSAALMDLDALAFEMPSALAIAVTFIFRA